MPVEDRAADTWEPLIAFADLAGGDWPDRPGTPAALLTAGAAQPTTPASEIACSADLRIVSDTTPRRCSTTTLLDRLEQTWRRRPGPTSAATARPPGPWAMLRDYGIRSTHGPVRERQAKQGYRPRRSPRPVAALQNPRRAHPAASDTPQVSPVPDV